MINMQINREAKEPQISTNVDPELRVFFGAWFKEKLKGNYYFEGGPPKEDTPNGFFGRSLQPLGVPQLFESAKL